VHFSFLIFFVHEVASSGAMSHRFFWDFVGMGFSCDDSFYVYEAKTLL
jgi:hypothetical protein